MLSNTAHFWHFVPCARAHLDQPWSAQSSHLEASPHQAGATQPHWPAQSSSEASPHTTHRERSEHTPHICGLYSGRRELASSEAATPRALVQVRASAAKALSSTLTWLPRPTLPRGALPPLITSECTLWGPSRHFHPSAGENLRHTPGLHGTRRCASPPCLSPAVHNPPRPAQPASLPAQLPLTASSGTHGLSQGRLQGSTPTRSSPRSGKRMVWHETMDDKQARSAFRPPRATIPQG